MALTKVRGTSLDFDDETDDYFELDGAMALYPEMLDEVEKITTTYEKDKFLKITTTAGLTPKMKRKANQLIKLRQNEAGDVKSKYEDEEYLNGYDLFDIKHPPYDLNALANIFEENYIHNAACTTKAVNCCGLGWDWRQSKRTIRKVSKTPDIEKKKRILERAQDEMEALDELFETFSTEETFAETFQRAMIDYYSLGNGYIEIGRNNAGQIRYVGHVPAVDIRVRRKRDGFIQMTYNKAQQQYVFFRNFQDKVTVDPTGKDPRPNELIHLKMYTPTNTFYGVPSIISAMAAVVGDKFAKQYNIDYFENKAIPRYAIVVKGAKLSAESTREVVKFFRNEIKGKSHGTLIIPLPAQMGDKVDIKFEKLEADIQDGSFQKYRNSNRDEIISVHRVPPSKLGVNGQSNLAISRDGDKTFKEQVIGPDQTLVENKINRIVKEYTDMIVFEFTKMDIVDEDMRSRIDDRLARLGALTRNEIRDARGLPAIEGGDEPLPFPTEVQMKNLEMTAEQQKAQLDQNKELAEQKHQVDIASARAKGGQPGNTNNPAKTGPETPKDQNGTRAERGQVQDEQGVRERS